MWLGTRTFFFINLLANKIDQRNVTIQGAWGGHFLLLLLFLFSFPFGIKNNVVRIVTVQ